MKDIIIAVDGYAASGKSTLAKNLAKHLQYSYIDTGAMYRAITLFFLDNNIDLHQPNDVAKALSLIELKFIFDTSLNDNVLLLNGQNVNDAIRMPRINQFVSDVAAIENVRKWAVLQQQQMGKNKRLVMDGRDIGTVVFPNAEIKFFITADIDERAKRRLKESQKNQPDISIQEVKNNLLDRDFKDSNRAIGPLKKAPDAIEIDNTLLSVNEQFLLACDYLKKIV